MLFNTTSTDTKPSVSNIEVRALLAIIFAGAIVAGFFVKFIDPQAFLAIGGPVIGWYFGQRNRDDATTAKSIKPTKPTNPNPSP